MADNRLIYYDKNAGLYRASKTDIKNSLKEVITEAYGDVLLDDNYPDGIVINGFTEMIDQSFSAIETIYNMLDINNAEGVVLDTLGNIRNDHRRSAKNSYLYVNVTVEETCTFTKSSFTLKDENNNTWILESDLTVTVESGQTSSTAVGVFYSYVVGPVAEPTIVTIASSETSLPLAVENITLSINRFVEGEAEETDISFRNRMNNYNVFNSITLKENLTSQLFNLDYIKDVKVYYNNATIPLNTKGNLMSIPSGNMLVLIKSSIDFSKQADLKQEVFDVIANYKGLGTLCWLPSNTTGIGTGYISTSGDPTIADGISQFLVPNTKTGFTITLRYIKTTRFDDTLIDHTNPSSITISENNIKNLLKSYINSKGIGENLTIGDLINYLYSNTNEIYVASLIITDSDVVNGTLVNNDKILYIQTSNITLIEES